jgi:acetolactate synthase I/II/III large subunit
MVGRIRLKVSVPRAIIQLIEKAGVKYVFGLPGAEDLPIYDAMIGSSVKAVLNSNEMFSAFMAGGYYRATGNIAACIAVAGPGITNMLSGMAEALCDSVAIILFVVTLGDDGKYYHTHEVDNMDMARPVVKKILRLSGIDTLKEEIAFAFETAKSKEPGPVIVEIPKEFLKMKTDLGVLEDPEKKCISSIPEDVRTIEGIRDILNAAERCGIYAGGGALDAADKIIELAELFSMPVATTATGRGVFPEDHPLSVGFGFGPSGTRLAEKTFKQCDVVLALGCKFSEASTGHWGLRIPGKLIHIDINEDVFNKNYKADITLCGDIRYSLDRILQLCRDHVVPNDLIFAQKVRNANKEPVGALNKKTIGNKLGPSDVFHALRESSTRETILVTDCGYHELWALSEFPVYNPRTFIVPTNFQAMGYGLPAAIGAKLGCPDKNVLCVTGDGGLLVNGFELTTSVREGLDLNIILFNDASLGIIKDLQIRRYGRTNAVDLGGVDYSSLAKAFGVQYHRIANYNELEDSFKGLKESCGVNLFDVHVEYSALPRYMSGLIRTLWHKMPLFQKIELLKESIR